MRDVGKECVGECADPFGNHVIDGTEVNYCVDLVRAQGVCRQEGVHTLRQVTCFELVTAHSESESRLRMRQGWRDIRYSAHAGDWCEPNSEGGRLLEHRHGARRSIRLELAS